MAGIDLTGKDPFSPFTPNINRALGLSVGDTGPSLISSLLPGVGSLLSGSRTQTTSNISNSSGYSGIGNFNVGTSDSLFTGTKTNQAANMAIVILVAGAALIALVKVLR